MRFNRVCESSKETGNAHRTHPLHAGQAEQDTRTGYKRQLTAGHLELTPDTASSYPSKVGVINKIVSPRKKRAKRVPLPSALNTMSS